MNNLPYRRKRLSFYLLTVCLIATGLLPAIGSEPGKSPSRESKTARLVEQSRFSIPAADVSGIRIDELSGLAWDEDEQLLYAVSDKGNVFHFRLKLEGNALVACEPVSAAALADPEAKASPSTRFNAEGLTVQNASNGKSGDTMLVVSLESDRARIIRFSPAGVALGELPVPSPLDDPSKYRKGKATQGLEAVAYHPEHGLMTAPESPLPGRPDNLHTLYAGDRHWSFERHSRDSRLKAIDLLADGNALVLERSQTGKGSNRTVTPSLRKVNLVACPRDGTCVTETLGVLPAGSDNFEGMTLMGDHRVLIVSDHDAKDPGSTTLMLLTLP